MEKGLRLYNYCRSTASWRVRIALNFKGIQYEYIPINIAKEGGGDQRTPEYEKINPMKHVPSLQIGDETLVESVAIIEYLEELKPLPPLLPTDPILKAKVRAACEFVNAGIQPLVNLKVMGRIEKECKYDKIEWSKYWVIDGLSAIEKYLSPYQGKYSFGDEITMADIFLHPQLQAAIDRFKIDLTPFPRLSSILENLSQVKAFQDALPKNQPDFPK